MRIEQLETRYVLNGHAVLADDAFPLRENGPQVGLDVLANDVFGDEYQGPRLITSVSYGSEGGRIAVAADRRSILYTPPADFFGTETFVYAVDGQYTAQVEVSVAAPLTFDNYTIPPDGQVHVLDVLANDPFWSDYTDPRQITAASVGSAGGTIEIAPDGKSIRYTPPEEEFGKETFIYVVDEIYPAVVTIEIPETLTGDRYEFVQRTPAQPLNVLANDPFWPGYAGDRRITHVTASRIGAMIEISSDGRSLVYAQPADFGDEEYRSHIYDTFRYVVDGTYEAEVLMILYRPVWDDSFELDANSAEFFFNVTLNDRYGGADNNLYDVSTA